MKKTPQHHAKFSPSGAHKWMACPGSLTLEQDIPNTSSNYADEGTAAHEVAAWCLSQNRPASDFLGKKIWVINGKYHPSDKPLPDVISSETQWVVTQDMVDHITTYIDVVKSHAEVKGAQLFVEQRVEFSHLVKEPEQFGTSDAIVISGTELAVIDLKYGMGVEVSAQENPQLMIYALGAYELHKFFYDIRKVRLVICQPRIGALSEWDLSVEDLLAFGQQVSKAADQVRAAAKSDLEFSKGENIYLSPGEKQCKFCRAKGTCPALSQKVFYDLSEDFVDLDNFVEVENTAQRAVTDIANATTARLAIAMNAVDLVEIWCKGIREAVMRHLIAGDPVSGYKLVKGRKGHRKWKDDQEAEKFLTNTIGSDAFNTSLISPADAEKRFKKAKDKLALADLDLFTVQSEGKISVAPTYDPREAVTPENIDDMFEDIQGDD